MNLQDEWLYEKFKYFSRKDAASTEICKMFHRFMDCNPRLRLASLVELEDGNDGENLLVSLFDYQSGACLFVAESLIKTTAELFPSAQLDTLMDDRKMLYALMSAGHEKGAFCQSENAPDTKGLLAPV